MNDSKIQFQGETEEGNPVNISIAIQRDRGTFNEVTVPWALSPETDVDLQPSSGVIVFPAGQNYFTLVLQTVDDDVRFETDVGRFCVCVVCVCVCACACVCVCVCVHVCVCACLCVCVCVCVCVTACESVCVHAHACTPAHACLCVCVCMFVCGMCVCVSMCV